MGCSQSAEKEKGQKSASAVKSGETGTADAPATTEPQGLEMNADDCEMEIEEDCDKGENGAEAVPIVAGEDPEFDAALTKIFERVDKDKDGKVTKKELTSAMTMMRTARTKFANDILRDTDANTDEQITLEGWIAGMNQKA